MAKNKKNIPRQIPDVIFNLFKANFPLESNKTTFSVANITLDIHFFRKNKLKIKPLIPFSEDTIRRAFGNHLENNNSVKEKDYSFSPQLINVLIQYAYFDKTYNEPRIGYNWESFITDNNKLKEDGYIFPYEIRTERDNRDISSQRGSNELKIGKNKNGKKNEKKLLSIEKKPLNTNKNKIREYVVQTKNSFQKIFISFLKESTEIDIKDIIIPLWETKSTINSEIRNIYQLFEYEKNKNILILGEGGQGKSTLTKWVYYKYAAQYLDFEFDTLPIYIDLKNNQTVDDVIKLICNNDIQFIKELNDSKKIIIIDSLDEFIGNKQKLVNEISHHAKFNNKIFLVSRNIDLYPDLESIFSVYNLPNLKNDDDKLKLITNIIKSRETAEFILKNLEEIEFNELNLNPFYLTIIAQEYAKTKNINALKNKGLIFQIAYVDNYLLKWEYSTTNELTKIQYELNYPNKMVDILSVLAIKSLFSYEYVDKKKNKHIIGNKNEIYPYSEESLKKIINHLKISLDIKNDTKNVIDSFIDSKVLNTDSNNRYIFTNENLREYFVALSYKKIFEEDSILFNSRDKKFYIRKFTDLDLNKIDSIYDIYMGISKNPNIVLFKYHNNIPYIRFRDESNIIKLYTIALKNWQPVIDKKLISYYIKLISNKYIGTKIENTGKKLLNSKKNKDKFLFVLFLIWVMFLNSLITVFELILRIISKGKFGFYAQYGIMESDLYKYMMESGLKEFFPFIKTGLDNIKNDNYIVLGINSFVVDEFRPIKTYFLKHKDDAEFRDMIYGFYISNHYKEYDNSYREILIIITELYFYKIDQYNIDLCLQLLKDFDKPNNLSIVKSIIKSHTVSENDFVNSVDKLDINSIEFQNFVKLIQIFITIYIIEYPEHKLVSEREIFKYHGKYIDEIIYNYILLFINVENLNIHSLAALKLLSSYKSHAFYSKSVLEYRFKLVEILYSDNELASIYCLTILCWCIIRNEFSDIRKKVILKLIEYIQCNNELFVEQALFIMRITGNSLSDYISDTDKKSLLKLYNTSHFIFENNKVNLLYVYRNYNIKEAFYVGRKYYYNNVILKIENKIDFIKILSKLNILFYLDLLVFDKFEIEIIKSLKEIDEDKDKINSNYMYECSTILSVIEIENRINNSNPQYNRNHIIIGDKFAKSILNEINKRHTAFITYVKSNPKEVENYIASIDNLDIQEVDFYKMKAKSIIENIAKKDS